MPTLAPFHLAFPVDDLAAARRFYGGLLGCPEGRSSAESLEQLRVLWHGERIAVHISPQRPGPGVDTPEDLVRVRQAFA